MKPDPHIEHALATHADLDGLAWVDIKTGSVVRLVARDAESRAALDMAAQAAPQLCVVPRMNAVDDDGCAEEAIAASDTKVYLFAPARARPCVAVVAVARRTSNVALLLASVRSLSDTLSDEELQKG